MERIRSKRIGRNREKPGVSNKKQKDEEKKTKGEDEVKKTSNSSEASVSEQGIENIIVVGKKCNIAKSKTQGPAFCLHECQSETALHSLPENHDLPGNLPTKQYALEIPSASCTSFISAQSDISLSDSEAKQIEDIKEFNKDFSTLELNCMQDINQENVTDFNSVFAENDYQNRLKEMEKKFMAKEKEIRELHHTIEECNLYKVKKTTENRDLTHQVNVLNRQLQSMYELLGQKAWNKSIDTVEFLKYKNRITELESVIDTLKEDADKLKINIASVTFDLNAKEKELNIKNKELIDYKNRSTLEMCKLINKIDSLKKNIQNQTENFDNKICEAQNSLDDELVRITTKLEDQYQKDLKSATDKLQKDFERVANLPESTIQKLLDMCKPGSIDWLSLKQNKEISTTENMESLDIINLTTAYENQISSLKNENETLLVQLKEKNGILDVLESELISSKMSSGIKCENLSELKQLYESEIWAEKQVHQLELGVFEEKVKTLSYEILYRAKNEENHQHELENARKMAYTYREKYENLIVDWGERVQKDFEILIRENVGKVYLDDVFDHIKSLLYLLQKVEEIHEERVKKLMLNHEAEITSYKQDIDDFKNKIIDLELFQSDQLKLDATIQELIESVGNNYMKTVEALVTSHVTELSLKQLEMFSVEKKYLDEIATLKVSHKEEVDKLQESLSLSGNTAKTNLLEENHQCHDINTSKIKVEDVSLELLKYEAMIAIKEETEQALVQRVQQLEELLHDKEENCRREMEGLVAQLVEVKVMSSAKDDLAKELEEKLCDSEKLLEKSCHDVDALYSVCSVLSDRIRNIPSESSGDKGDFISDADGMRKYLLIKTNGEQLKHCLLDVYEKLDRLEEERKRMMEDIKSDEFEKATSERDLVLEEKRKLEINLNLAEKMKSEALEENTKLKKECNAILQELEEKNQIIMKLNVEIQEAKIVDEELKKLQSRYENMEKKLHILESENEALLKAKESERAEMEEKNKALEEELVLVGERMNNLVIEAERNRALLPEPAISSKDVKILYVEETPSKVERSSSATSVACQVGSSAVNSVENMNELFEKNNKLRDENESLKVRLNGLNRNGPEMDKCKGPKDEVLLSKFRKKLSEAITERNGWMTISKSLETERERLREEIENLRKENFAIRTNFEIKLKMYEEMQDTSDTAEDTATSGNAVVEMRREIEQLSNYINTLSGKLDAMRENNEKLLCESNEHLKNNKNLTNELEEAWTERYEVEDQLTKVRRENALLNLHRAQLEVTNRRISNLITEGKPSVISWIQIHEIVENIVDEVLALKSSFSEVGLTKGPSGEPEKNQSGPNLMTENLHTQLHSKTLLCDELLVQKRTLEKELKNLEDLLKKNDTRILSQRRFVGDFASYLGRRKSDEQTKQSRICPLEICLTSGKCDVDSVPVENVCSETHFGALTTLLKKHLEAKEEAKGAQLGQNLEQEIHGLNKEIQNLELDLTKKRNAMDELKAEKEREVIQVEISHEAEVLELMKEFEREVAKLRSTFAAENASELEEKDKEQYTVRCIEKIRKDFEAKHVELEKKYAEIYDALDKKILNNALESEKEQVINCFRKLHRTNEGKIQETELENFLSDIVVKYIGEIKSIHNEYRKNLLVHASEVEKLRFVIDQLKESLRCTKEALDENRGEEKENEIWKVKQEVLLLLEEEKEKHKAEILNVEQLWAKKLEKLLEDNEKIRRKKETSNTSCSDDVKVENQDNLEKMQNSVYQDEDETYTSGCVPDLDGQLIAHKDEIQPPEKSGFCSSCLSNVSYLDRVEMETDDDKLKLAQERDSLKEMVFSLRLVVTKLLNFVGECGRDSKNDTLKDFNGEETFYRSFKPHLSDTSFCANLSNAGLDISTIVQEINDHSLLNSSEQVRFEVEKYLQQLKEDAAGLLQLSEPDGSKQLSELVKKVQKQKDSLQEKVQNMEKTQEALREDVESTKNKLAQWERNLEVVSEGYGEEVIEPKKATPPSELKNKIKVFLTEHYGQSTHEANILDEIYKEGYRLQEEWKKEKIDLEQQIDVAHKQLHSLRKFMEEQANERELEREAFDREINDLKESLKSKERDAFIQNRTNREVDALESQVKDLTAQIYSVEQSKKSVDVEFQNAVKKIWSLREVIQDLEVQLAEINERELGQTEKIGELKTLLDEQIKINADLKNELELWKNEKEIRLADHIKHLEEERLNLRQIVDQVNPEALARLKTSLRHIESTLVKKTKDLEQMHVTSTNVSCSSPSEDISIRDHIDVTRCSTPDEMCSNQSQSIALPLDEIERLHEKLAKHTRAEEVALKYIQDLKMQLRNNRKICDELETERDVLLERADLHLKENSNLKARLEEQRCNAALLQKQLNADLECQIKRLETELEKLSDLCLQKDKQLHDMKEVLENTSKALNVRETEALNKSKEENALISTLKTDLENEISVRQKLEENLEKMKEKLQNSLKIPALLDSMLEEKNEEIDRLEKEVSRLSSENSSLLAASKEFNEENKSLKSGKRIKFSEPESFTECISTISPYNPSVMRNCSDSFGDFRNSSFKIRQSTQYSKLESLSSIGPLQLSPRGMDVNTNWKTSSPMVVTEESPRPKEMLPDVDSNFDKMFEESRLLSQIESKKREALELKLEVDTYKRQLVEMTQQLENAKGSRKDFEVELETKNEEINKFKDKETQLMLTIESLKRNHMEEIEELQNKLIFERGKVEKVYGEIKTLEVKNVEIQEAFLGLKEDYNEKLQSEQKMVKMLMEKIKDLEVKNSKSELACAEIKEDMKNVVEESKEVVNVLQEQLSELRKENEALKIEKKNFENAEVQVNFECTETACQDITNEFPSNLELKSNSCLNENFEKLKSEIDGMARAIRETEFNKDDAFAYLGKIKTLVSMTFSNICEAVNSTEDRRKKFMESSVDELAIKVQKELLLSATLDNKLLSKIEVNGSPSSSQKVVNAETSIEIKDEETTDNVKGDEESTKNFATRQELAEKIKELENEKNDLMQKAEEGERLINFLEENLLAEKERIAGEKERCKEDAKIMELLRVNLEKGLRDIKEKDKELRRERQIRQSLEKEVETIRRSSGNVAENKRIADLLAQMKAQDEKLSALTRDLDNEKLKSNELRLMCEQSKNERIAEKEAQRLFESDFNLLKEQKENIKAELIKTKLMLHSREKQINFLKRKVNLQEIDIKALGLSSDFQQQNISDSSTSEERKDKEMNSTVPQVYSKSLLLKVKKLNNCVERHVQESNQMGEALLHLTEETEQMRSLMKKLEESTELKLADETLVADVDVERKLWNLEKRKHLTEIESLQAENELAKRELLNTSKENEVLKLENCKLKAEVKLLEKEATSQIEMAAMRDRISLLLGKYLRTESYRKALIWQKQYLTVSLNSYRSSEEVLRKFGRIGSRKKEIKVKCGRNDKFRIAALAVTAVFRMKFIVKRWQRHKPAPCPPPEPEVQAIKDVLPPSFLNVHNEPLNPLSFQTRHICHRTTRVLKTPPSRDPGLQSFSPEIRLSDTCHLKEDTVSIHP